jgi:hypothetical protein
MRLVPALLVGTVAACSSEPAAPPRFPTKGPVSFPPKVPEPELLPKKSLPPPVDTGPRIDAGIPQGERPTPAVWPGSL